VEQVVKRPCLVLGASLGAAAAVDLAVEQPRLVSSLVVLDGQVFEKAPSLPGPAAWLGVQVLRAVWLRSFANQLAYFDKARCATQDAMRVGRLHTWMPGWTEANVAFIASGGYAVSEKLSRVTQPTTVVWGRDDEIVPLAVSERFLQAIPGSRRVIIDECGHVAHLERPTALVGCLLDILATTPATV
jgi:pimeloyl-ACP methyl ester carboxylesterase